LAAVAGRLTSVRAKAAGVIYGCGEGIGFLESGRYFGVIRAPVRGTLLAVNDAALRKPRLLSDSPYGDGWFARLRPEDWRQDRAALKSAVAAKDVLRSQIAALRIRCFAAFPDYEMVEIGVECSAVLVKLNELIARIEVGEVVHIVSDDATAPVEMAQWTDQTGHPVVDARREGNLFHYLVRKA
jgi:glycine cleavage system H lipoate-binding protein/TusA-related sulfurtransferase